MASTTGIAFVHAAVEQFYLLCKCGNFSAIGVMLITELSTLKA